MILVFNYEQRYTAIYEFIFPKLQLFLVLWKWLYVQSMGFKNNYFPVYILYNNTKICKIKCTHNFHNFSIIFQFFCIFVVIATLFYYLSLQRPWCLKATTKHNKNPTVNLNDVTINYAMHRTLRFTVMIYIYRKNIFVYEKHIYIYIWANTVS